MSKRGEDPLSLPLRRTTSAELVRLISADIQRGKFGPGQPLRQRDLAAQYGVSTTPVREALQVLVAQGVADADPHRGTVVAILTAAEVREAYEIRKALEGLAIAAAVKAMPQEAIASAAEAVKAMEDSDDRSSWVQLNEAFHFELYRWARMPRLIGLISSLRDVAAYYVESAYDELERRGEAMADHHRILDACARRDAAGARRAVEAHLEHGAALAMTRAEEASPTPSSDEKESGHEFVEPMERARV